MSTSKTGIHDRVYGGGVKYYNIMSGEGGIKAKMLTLGRREVQELGVKVSCLRSSEIVAKIF